MSYRLINSNALAIKYPEVNEMPCVFADLPEGMHGQFIEEPIRCEQCQHSRKCITGAYRCCLWMITRMADDFCSEAKRREEKTDAEIH